MMEVLGKGGMGIVYKAQQIALRRVVALKMILHGDYADDADRRRFRTEAETIAQLQHPQIVQIYDVGEHNGLPYFSLEYCAGGSLEKQLAGTPWEQKRAAALIEVLARAVHAAHQAGLVHRDLKPGNILLTADGTPKVTDFGLVKRIGGGGDTQSGVILGTPEYMAPEQAGGKSKQVGPAADIYALGTILYELLTGRPPFKAATQIDTVLQVLADEPVPVRRLQPKTPADLETICLKCLHKQPQKRYASAADLADDLRRFLDDAPIHARPTGIIERAVKWVRKRPAVAALLAAVLLVAAAGVAAFAWEYRQAVRDRQDAQEKREEADQRLIALNAAHFRRVLAELDHLQTASPSAVPSILADLQKDQDQALPILRSDWERKKPADHGRRMRIALALIPAMPEAVKGPLVEWMLQADDPREVVLAREALRPWAQELTPDLWKHAGNKEAAPELRLRALAALAVFDPGGAGWQTAADSAVAQLLSVNPLHLGVWTEALRPAAAALRRPLVDVFRGSNQPGDRLVAATVLAAYVGDDPIAVADLAADAEGKQVAVLASLVDRHREQLVPLLERELGAFRTGQDGAGKAERAARIAALLVSMGHDGPAWPLLRRTERPDVRSHLIARLGIYGKLPLSFIDAGVKKDLDLSARRAFLVGLGEFPDSVLTGSMRQGLLDRLLPWYQDDPDPGIHGAIDWLLRHGKEGKAARKLDWGQAPELARLDEELRGKPPGKRLWYVNGQGQTFTIVPGPVEFLMGSPVDEPGRFDDEPQHRQQIVRGFAIATKTVTVAEFDRFLAEHPKVTHGAGTKYNPEPNCPMVGVSWYDAAQYCRWLSEKEEVPADQMCYPPIADIEKSKDGRTPLRFPSNYLQRTGYRLPTEAEWEYACRARTTTPWFSGSSAELLDRYAWHHKNSDDRTWPVGQKRPNDLGLFDMHGNVWQWCDGETPTGGADKGDHESRSDTKFSPPIRGGAFIYHPWVLRCANRRNVEASIRNYTYGFRPARTYP
jgi:formylglycine-generating enzyme required for sulfatase activity/tRNA A-37 threonylcarbamoyl transferase component Bud32